MFKRVARGFRLPKFGSLLKAMFRAIFKPRIGT